MAPLWLAVLMALLSVATAQVPPRAAAAPATGRSAVTPTPTPGKDAATAASARVTPPAAPAGHEASTGVALARGGFVTVTAVWVTAGLAADPYYAAWVPDERERTVHARAAGLYTVMLVEVDNVSPLTLEGYLSVNVRLRVEGVLRRPIADAALARLAPSLLPPREVEQIPPRSRFLRAYAFPRVEPAARDVQLVVRPLWLFERRRQVGALPEFELRFRPEALAFPP
ncbi:MAG: hypothetical protein QN122_05315 [Armatimonadota bacterium]|nr:hypothetical protein [Armatimonadota bacterium]MDR7450181.1 hypothetical protein [Armatimonadota bacterium]MDR7459214.1 hypothetical protein [Armatimonadota bacterium]MDR7479684.1 hypothetical protein [Armatimonadota bacterium]MDR7487821.1 hypothetical protein [Armatimonadota bacterium]